MLVPLADSNPNFEDSSPSFAATFSGLFLFSPSAISPTIEVAPYPLVQYEVPNNQYIFIDRTEKVNYQLGQGQLIIDPFLETFENGISCSQAEMVGKISLQDLLSDPALQSVVDNGSSPMKWNLDEESIDLESIEMRHVGGPYYFQFYFSV